MTMSVSRGGEEPAFYPTSAYSSERPPGALFRFDIVSRVASELLPRVFGIIGSDGVIPAAIDYRLEPGRLHLAITAELDGRRLAALIATAFRRIISVEEVALTDQMGQPIDTGAAP